jgi:serine/threonine protein phosphatase PrpC
VNVAFGYDTASRSSGENHDAFGAFLLGRRALLVVCDGQGGSVAALQASTLAVQAVHDAVAASDLEPDVALLEAIIAANRAIYEEARKNHRLMGMSTSIAACLIEGSVATVAHVGNCRAYHVRQGRGAALTRDHTMVNTFVDNELLSPEDAATHPEAHVLSRSLGSERQIDVEIHEISLSDGDVVVLCTDGVHRMLDDAMITEGDWSQPDRAAMQAIRRVQSRGAPDAATLVGVRYGGFGETGQPATSLPVAESSGDHPTPLSMDEVRSPTLFDEPQPPALYPIDPADEPTAASSDNPSAIPLRSATELPSSPRPAALPPRVAARTPSPAPIVTKPHANRRQTAVRIALLVLALCVLLVGSAVVIRNLLEAQRDSRLEAAALGAQGDPVAVAAVAPADPEGVRVSAPEGTEPDPLAPPPELQPEDQSGFDLTRNSGDFATVRIPPLRRNKRTPQVYTNAPPDNGSRARIQAEIAKGKGCEGVEREIDASLRNSPEAAPLYRDLWMCFQDLHDPNIGGRIPTAMAFIEKRPHLEGNPVQPNPDAPLPLWFLPATSGIERRMDLYNEPEGKFHLVVEDAIEAELVATRFHYDLMAEAAYAESFSNLPNPTAGQIQDWARRVFTVRRHLDSRVGQTIVEQDPSAHRRIRAVLAASTFDFEKVYTDELNAFLASRSGADRKDFAWKPIADRLRLPYDVAEALLVAANQVPAPTGRPTVPDPATVPKRTSTGPRPVTDPTELIP